MKETITVLGTVVVVAFVIFLILCILPAWADQQNRVEAFCPETKDCAPTVWQILKGPNPYDGKFH